MIQKEIQLYEQQIEKFSRRLIKMIYESEIQLSAEYMTYERHTTFQNRLHDRYQSINVDEKWGSDWDRAWFHVTGEIPKEWKGAFVVARLHLGGEGCIFNQAGEPVQAISCHTIWGEEFRRERFVITQKATGGEKIDLWIDMTAAELFGLHLENDPVPTDVKRYGHHDAVIKDLTLAIFREEIWQLYLDISLLYDLMRALPQKSVRRAKIRTILGKVANSFDGSDANASAMRKELNKVLENPANASALTAVAVGHAHIDTAWLWPLSETIKKCARTFSTQIALIKKYPGYIFGASQPQQYQFMKEHYPSLYGAIQQSVADETWELQGGMWVEADCNLISGESMVRQFLYGINFFKDEFGVRVKNLWLPDVFGYSAAMPQILQKCGIPAMVTQKISWNQINKFPYHSFVWRGIDGSEIVVHFPPEDTYNSELKPSSLRHAESNFNEKGILDEFLVLFGVGDGGGGPTEEIIESGLRQQNLEGSPKIVFDKAQNMLDRLVQQKEKLPRWVGELYLELHRGTLTTHACNKKLNRFMELKLRELEILYATSALPDYPSDAFEAMWKKLLMNQFHDIIPGSSINLVYRDSDKDYGELKRKADELHKMLIQKIIPSKKDTLCLVNTLSFAYTRPVELPAEWREYEVLDDTGKVVDVQSNENAVYMMENIPALCAKSFFRGNPVQPKLAHASPIDTDSTLILENDLIRYELNNDGTIQRAFDKTCGREIFTADQFGNVLKLYEDRPNNWDAWDIDVFYEAQYREQAKLTSRRQTSKGPHIDAVEMNFTIGQSTLKQSVCLAKNSKRLEFKTHVDWQERHKMLRVGFHVNIRSEFSSYEIQYGAIKRPTHRNTSWERAKFEVAGHRFIDLSDNQYGVALLNDCKYGHKVLDNFMEINLLRSPTNPDPDADRGMHEFTYAILPHDKPLHQSEVLSEASQLNQGIAILPGVDAGKLTFPCKLDSEAVVMDVLKKAEKSDALIIRLYEPNGMHVGVNLLLTDLNKKLYETNLVEEDEKNLPVHQGKVSLKFSPFEIKTLKLNCSS
ncbi:MAG: alpha-mannosidase [Calditrichaeota bacterium]|nr:MAG: alpha-mannosidase [Calditrichota bacterium]